MAEVREGKYYEERAIWLRAGDYEAAVLPEAGGNLVALRSVSQGYRFLHEPAEGDMPAFKAKPLHWGIPILFPPNRYRDGRMAFNGRSYSFPVNEPRTGNHIHGYFYNRPWQVEAFGEKEGESYVSLVQHVNEEDEFYTYFPHSFTFRIRYALSGDGLRQHVCIRNEGAGPMPCLLGFHTAVNAPFAPGSSVTDCTARMTLGSRVELDGRMLPTGRVQPMTPEENRLKAEGISPYFAAMDNHYSAEPVDGRNMMELTDHKAGVKFVYDAGTAYKFWMIWNNNAKGGFFCPEPQISAVDAPNMKSGELDPQLSCLHPGQSWEETSRFYYVTV